ncbi:tryptophan synthase subunit alpha [Streptomyces sp. NPDC005931]|uniref:tryptophan synthase subunit alpha n=1 Tax=Streptomyces sp. NPDC005931 TaxID=3364737 RepID=UPI00369062A3
MNAQTLSSPRLARLLSQARRTALGAYLPAGFPDETACIDLLHSFTRHGADILEVGVPCAFPTLDGPVIAAAHEQALRQGTDMNRVMNTVHHAAESGAPVVVMSYWTSVLTHGVLRFAADVARAGAAGAMIPDLPRRHTASWLAAARSAGICTPQFAPRDADDDTLAAVAAAASGWIYTPAVAAASGYHGALDLPAMQHFTRRLRAHVDHPLVAGIGISTPARARAVAPFVDGIVIGTPVVRPLHRRPARTGRAEAVAVVREFARALGDTAAAPTLRPTALV